MFGAAPFGSRPFASTQPFPAIDAGGVTLSPAGGALSLTGAAATIAARARVASQTATLALTGGTATLRAKASLAASGGLLTLTGATATLSARASLAPVGGVLALIGSAATISGGVVTYTPSTTRQLSGGMVRSLSAPGDRLLFGGGVRSFQGE